jgi:hypothetical protein
MKKIVSLVTLLFSGFTMYSQIDSSLAQFNLLVGSWRYTAQANIYEEHWEKTDDQGLECRAFSINKTDTVSREYFRIEKVADQWRLTAMVQNQPDVFFTLKVAETDRLVFERQENDFPKRVNYMLKPEDQLVVWLDGDLNGQPMKLEYPMKKLD